MRTRMSSWVVINQNCHGRKTMEPRSRSVPSVCLCVRRKTSGKVWKWWNGWVRCYLPHGLDQTKTTMKPNQKHSPEFGTFFLLLQQPFSFVRVTLREWSMTTTTTTTLRYSFAPRWSVRRLRLSCWMDEPKILHTADTRVSSLSLSINTTHRDAL